MPFISAHSAQRTAHIAARGKDKSPIFKVKFAFPQTRGLNRIGHHAVSLVRWRYGVDSTQAGRWTTGLSMAEGRHRAALLWHRDKNACHKYQHLG